MLPMHSIAQIAAAGIVSSLVLGMVVAAIASATCTSAAFRECRIALRRVVQRAGSNCAATRSAERDSDEWWRRAGWRSWSAGIAGGLGVVSVWRVGGDRNRWRDPRGNWRFASVEIASAERCG